MASKRLPAVAALLTCSIAMMFGTPAAGKPAPFTARRAVVRRPVQHNPFGHFLGVVRATTGERGSTPAPNGTPPLTYHGGPVQHSSTAYAIFWVPKGTYMPVSYRTTVTQYFGDVTSDSYGVGNAYASDTQYYDFTGPGGSKSWISYDVHYGGSSTVHDTLPANGCPNYRLADLSTTSACLTDTQLQSEVASVVTARQWPRGLGTEFFLFTPPGIGMCFDAAGHDCYDASSGGFCAYHSDIAGSPTTLYAAQPFAAIDGCQYATPHGPLPNGDAADPVLNVVSHEHNETITDPLGTGWYDSSGYENGDECAWLATQFTPNGYGDYNQTIHSNEYLLQLEWSNRANACVVRNTYPQPTASIGVSASPTHGSATSFTSNASDSDDTSFTYDWDFADGGSSSSANPSHTFASAGSYRVTLIVFDAHGDQERVTKTVSVA